MLALLPGLVAPAIACTLEEDTGLSRDTLNHYYPDALSVLARVVEARRATGLPPAPGLSPTPVHMQRVMTLASRFDRQLRTTIASVPTGPVAVLLIESMLWMRVPALPGTRSTDLHASGPSEGDLVVVTSEDTLRRMVAGETTMAAARDDGMLKLYGIVSAVDGFMRAAGATGSQGGSGAGR